MVMYADILVVEMIATIETSVVWVCLKIDEVVKTTAHDCIQPTD
jgi:hypothetical protein